MHTEPPSRSAATDTFQAAMVLYQRSDLRGAEQVCRRLIEAQPRHLQALTLLGIIAGQSGRIDESADCFTRAMSIQPAEPSVVHNYATVLTRAGRSADALNTYQQSLALSPRDPQLHLDYANLLRSLGRTEQACASYRSALRLRPDFAEAHHALGLTLHTQNSLADALASYEHALHLKPAFPQALSDRGVTLQALGRPAEALRSYDRALALAPDYADALYNRGNALSALERFPEALESYRRARGTRPERAEIHNNLGLTLRRLGRYLEALDSFGEALRIRPGFTDACLNRARTLRDLGRDREALDACRQALDASPHHVPTLAACGDLWMDLRRPEDALGCYERALALDPAYPWLPGQRLIVRMQTCDWREFESQVATVADAVEQGKEACSPLGIVAFIDSPRLQLRAARTWVERKYPQAESGGPAPHRATGDKIRLGYYSADYDDRTPVALLTTGMFEHHDRGRFEVFAISFGPDPGAEHAARPRAAFDRFIDVRDRSDEQVAQLSRDLQIDIAVDLQGHTGNARTGIFARRAAPLQVGYLGYPGTMGAPYIDYLIADHVLIPQASRPHYSERIVCLPNSYQANDRRPIGTRDFARSELGLPEEAFVFCCFNNAYKINPIIFDTWMRILRQVPDSVLWLMQINETAARNLRREAQARGVEAQRVLFAQREPRFEDHMARHRAADLFLDTLPFNAHTTASDALWAGLPLLTRLGESLAGRVAASLLTALGLEELIAKNAAEYEALAVELAGNGPRLTGIRRRLANARLARPLFDTSRFTRCMESAYVQMHELRRSGRPPADIDILAP